MAEQTEQTKTAFSSVEEAIDDIRAGRFVRIWNVWRGAAPIVANRALIQASGTKSAKRSIMEHMKNLDGFRVRNGSSNARSSR